MVIALGAGLIFFIVADVLLTRRGLKLGYPEKGPVAKCFSGKHLIVVTPVRIVLLLTIAGVGVYGNSLIPLACIVGISATNCLWNSFILLRRN